MGLSAGDVVRTKWVGVELTQLPEKSKGSDEGPGDEAMRAKHAKQ